MKSLTPEYGKWQSYIWYNFERKYSFCGVAKVASSTWRSHNRDLVGHERFDAYIQVKTFKCLNTPLWRGIYVWKLRYITWPKYLEKYSRIIASLLYSNEIQICWEFFSKIYQIALAMVKNASNQKSDSTFTLKTFLDRQLCFYVKKLFVSEKTQKSELFHFS